MIYELLVPTNFRPDVDDAGTIHSWLESQGITVESVSIANHDDNIVLLVESNEDPSNALEDFPVTVTPKEELADALDDLDLENASVEELKTAVILLRALVTQ